MENKNLRKLLTSLEENAPENNEIQVLSNKIAEKLFGASTNYACENFSCGNGTNNYGCNNYLCDGTWRGTGNTGCNNTGCKVDEQ